MHCGVTLKGEDLLKAVRLLYTRQQTSIVLYSSTHLYLSIMMVTNFIDFCWLYREIQCILHHDPYKSSNGGNTVPIYPISLYSKQILLSQIVRYKEFLGVPALFSLRSWQREDSRPRHTDMMRVSYHSSIAVLAYFCQCMLNPFQQQNMEAGQQ